MPGPRSWPRTSRRTSPATARSLGYPEAVIRGSTTTTASSSLPRGDAPAGGRHDRLGRAQPRLPGRQPRRRVRRGQGGRVVDRWRGRRPRSQRLIGLPRSTQVVRRRPPASRIARDRASGHRADRAGRAAARRCSRRRSRPGRRAPVRHRGSGRRASPSWARISGRVARPRAARRRWPRSSAAARRPPRAPGGVRGPGRAARSSAPRRSAPPGSATSGRCGTTTVSPPGQQASARPWRPAS